MTKEAAVFDAELMLSYLDGEMDIALAMLESLVEDMPERLKCLNEALASGDYVVARREAHTIKGLANGGGATPLSAVAYTIEVACRDGTMETARNAHADIQMLIPLTMTEWKDFLAKGMA
jgi:HPt (histidine-containing phosphotransfer) domain-containing protein